MLSLDVKRPAIQTQIRRRLQLTVRVKVGFGSLRDVSGTSREVVCVDDLPDGPLELQFGVEALLGPIRGHLEAQDLGLALGLNGVFAVAVLQVVQQSLPVDGAGAAVPT
eukprot:scaffold131165_cov41-Prasinocladus_malaysianus.AAC.1